MNISAPIHLLVVDDHTLFRRGLIALLAGEMTSKLVSAFQALPSGAAADAARPVLPAAPPPAAPAPSALDSLSPREREILQLIAQGASNKEIARALSIAETTVKIHVQHILRKLDLSSRVQAAVFAASRPSVGGSTPGGLAVLRHDARMNTPKSALAAHLIRNLHQVPLEHWVRAPLYENQGAQISAGTAARKLGVSLDIVPPGKQSCPYHFHHAQEELFIVLEGSGTLRVAGERLPISAGDVITIPPGPEYPHHILNTSDALLKYLSISTKEYPEVCEYPDSGKVLAMNAVDGRSTLRSMHRKADAVDYWEGEA